jgi:O-antigen/teichoic acid export membrane protein
VAVKVRTAADVVRNAVALMFSTVASAAFGMLFWVAGARLYNVEDLGRASAAVSAITLLGGLAQLSLNSVFIRFLPTAGEATGRFIGLSYGASASTAVILAVGFFVFGLGEDFLPPGPVALGAFCIAVVCSTFSGLQDSVLTALRRTAWVPVENIAIAVGKLALLPVFVGGAIVAPLLIAWGLPIVVAVVVLSAVIFLRLAPTQARRMRGRQALPNRGELLAFMSAQNLNGILGNLSMFLPPLLVTMVLGPEQTGLFYVPWLIGTALFALSWNILVSLVVEASTDPSQIRSQLRHAFRLLVLVTVGGGAVLVLGAPLILGVLGSQYAEGGADSLRLIGLGLPFAVISTLFAATGFMAKKTWPIFFSQLASTVIFLGGAYFALHWFGIVGAAGAFLASEIVVGLALAPATVRRLRELVRSSEEKLAEEVAAGEKVLARGVAPVPARGVVTVPRLSPGYDTGPMQVLFLPAAVVDWERLGQIETVLMQRLVSPDDDPVSGTDERWQTDLTLPMQRISPDDVTIRLPSSPHGRGDSPGGRHHRTEPEPHLDPQSDPRLDPRLDPRSGPSTAADGEPPSGPRHGAREGSS